MNKIIVNEFKRGPYLIRHEIWEMEGGSPTLMKAAYSPEGYYIGNSRIAYRLWKKYGITKFFLRTDDNNVCSLGHNPIKKLWYGWSHRAIYGYPTRKQAEKFADSVA